MKKIIFVSLFIFLNFNMFPQIAQGSVLIDSFDPEIGGGNYDKEMVVLVNRTSSPINLNGYEILCYNFNATAHEPAFWQFTGSDSYILPPYRFLLLTRNTSSVSGVSGDLVRFESGGQIDYDGYLALKKINATGPSDFIDIVKYSQEIYPPTNPAYQFTAVPLNSGIGMSMPGVAFNTGPESYLTRGGVSSNINSLNYSNYGMVGQSVSDFFEVTQTNATYIQNSGSSPLPVELSAFSADVLREKEVKLNWRTETEVANYGFEIQRRGFGDNEWINIGFVAGSGNSNSPKDYSFTDNKPLNGSRFNYRLKQIDSDGGYEFSNVIEAEIVPEEYILNQNYPNPFNPVTKITYQLSKESKVVIKVYDLLGAEVASIVNETKEPGYYEVEFNGINLPSGTYIYRMTAVDFVEVKKMILMK
jgi:hypothetical protein